MPTTPSSHRILEKCYLFIASLFVLENFLGLNVSALVSLGSIGGLAVALSTQAVLADLIAGLIVFLDEPFKVWMRPRQMAWQCRV